MAAVEYTHFMKFCRNIICIARNYKEHAIELNNSVPESPILFLKPPSSFLQEGNPIMIPEGCKAVHHEVELGLLIGEPGSHIPEKQALNHIGGYTLALDMTARDLQDKIKEKGHPWFLAKCWDTFCPVSDFIPLEKIPDPQNVNLWLTVDGEMKQAGNTRDMIFNIPQIISYASKVMTLQKGDLILTGTPSGVGPVKAGQIIECGLEGIQEMKFKVE